MAYSCVLETPYLQIFPTAATKVPPPGDTERTCNNSGKKYLTVKTNLLLNADVYTMRHLKSTKSQCEQLPEYYNFRLIVHSLALSGSEGFNI